MSPSSTPATYDVVVIGAGPGGYVCAFRAAQLGLKVALIDKRPALGGTCLNVGCIPSKALLHSSEQYAFAQHHAAAHGIELTGVKLDLAKLLKKKDDVVAKLTAGVAALAKARKVTVLTGTAQFTSANTISVGDQTLTAKNIVIATGSAPVELPFLKFDGQQVVSSDHAIALPTVPQRLAVIGGGAIGLELGSVWARLGAEVTKTLQKQGLKIEVGAKVTGYDPKTKLLTAERGADKLTIPADVVLVAVGRRPYTDGLGLEKIGVTLDDKKRIAVDTHLRTNIPGVWAIGDAIAGPMLAHKAEEDGVAVAEWIAGQHAHVNWDLVPAIIYTEPEVASVGLGEEAAKAKGLAINIGKFNFAANGRAIATDATDGFVKLIADAQTDKILGCQILGKGAGELISEVVTHMEYGGSAEDLARTIHAHPTMSEAVKEAALAVAKRALHAI
jgi:dihydrolipoamide dehydrogenase